MSASSSTRLPNLPQSTWEAKAIPLTGKPGLLSMKSDGCYIKVYGFEPKPRRSMRTKQPARAQNNPVYTEMLLRSDVGAPLSALPDTSIRGLLAQPNREPGTPDYYLLRTKPRFTWPNQIHFIKANQLHPGSSGHWMLRIPRYAGDEDGADFKLRWEGKDILSSKDVKKPELPSFTQDALASGAFRFMASRKRIRRDAQQMPEFYEVRRKLGYAS